jgi:hypothetical protein
MINEKSHAYLAIWLTQAALSTKRLLSTILRNISCVTLLRQFTLFNLVRADIKCPYLYVLPYVTRLKDPLRTANRCPVLGTIRELEHRYFCVSERRRDCCTLRNKDRPCSYARGVT